MTRILPYITEQLFQIIKDLDYEEINIGCSDTHVFYIKNIDKDINGYLKVNSINNTEKLKHEVDILNWLKDKTSVPKVYLFEENEYFEFLLMSEIPGLPSHHQLLRSNLKDVISELAKGLKKLHSIDINDCPFNELISKKNSVIKQKIDRNEIDLENMLDQVLELKSNIREGLVFTHGDYCMPNIIINNNVLSGFVDLGRAGISDRYQDLALITRSMKYNNCSQEDINFFLEEYGLSKLNMDKVKFYKLMDELY